MITHDGRRIRAVVTVGFLPDFILELDPDLRPRTFRAAAPSPRLGGLVLVGVGDTVDDALEHLRGALDADAKLEPRGEG